MNRWRIVGTFRDSDSSAKEEFVYHNAGTDGYGSSSYIDAVILRDLDASNGFTGAADGTLETRRYYCQNWRADVIAFMTDAGVPIAYTRYGEYGVPFGMPVGDTDGDGDADANDASQISTWVEFGPYDVRGDVDLNGVLEREDESNFVTSSAGWGKLSQVGAAAGGEPQGLCRLRARFRPGVLAVARPQSRAEQR